MEGLNTIKDGFKALVVTLIVCVATQKGGAAKTTTLLCLAVCAWLAGYRVAIIDLDGQGSASSWGRQRAGKPPVVVSCGQLDLVATIHRLHDEDYELIFIDTGAAIGAAEKLALSVCDLALVPCAPSKMDLEATLPTARAIHALGKPFFFVVTKCPLGERRISDAQALLDRLGARAGDPIHYRVDFQDAISRGLGVTEHRRGGAAAQEILTLWRWTAAQLGLAEERVSDDEA